ncbi:MAG: hypothetical protein NTX86_02625 [Candidatus Dependentiae bacterium]|nr:hypothetical protein [Candidatus Dependentiae bacterium]
MAYKCYVVGHRLVFFGVGHDHNTTLQGEIVETLFDGYAVFIEC